jgi:flagellar hook-associated protein 3 FlgL
MSGAVSGFAALSSYGLLGRLTADGATVRQRLDTLTDQASTGKIARSYAGLGAGARISLNLNPAVTHQATLQTGIDQATVRMQVTQTAMTQIQQVASDLYAKLNDLNGLNASQVDSVAAWARDGLRQVAGLLDTKDGDSYVFAGQDSANTPVPQPDDILSSGFYSQIAASVGQLATNGASATAAATLATASSNTAGTSPFSASLSKPAAALAGQRSTVPVGEGQTEPVGRGARPAAPICAT